VAVLLSTFNGARFLEAQLDSLLTQEGVVVDLFARDDGSSDATLEILARFAHLWPRLAQPMTGANLGPAGSFLGLLAAAPDGFDFYAFCDQDDVWLPGKLARACARLSAVNDPVRPALYCSRVMCVDEALQPIGERFISDDASFEHLLFENIAFGNTVVMNPALRAAILAKVPDVGVIMHDWWCALTASGLGVVVQDDWAGVLYRQHAVNVVGASPNPVQDFLTRLRALLSAPRRFYPVHAQAEAFLAAHKERLTPAHRRAVEALVRSRRSLSTRIAYACGGRVVRRTRLAEVAVRVLILLGWY
jgi:hypothetical protein